MAGEKPHLFKIETGVDMKLTNIFTLLILFLGALVAAQAEDEKRIEHKINALIARMTLTEKIGQMTLYTSDLDVTGPSIRKGYIQDIKAGKVGALFNAFSVNFTRKLQKIAIEKTRLKIPLLFGYDVIHGFKTIFPIPLAEAASWDLKAIEKSARISSIEATAAGLHWTFAPMVDIARDPRWGRVAEGAGEDPYLASLIARARVRGFQGKNLKGTDTLLACAKHFAAYGAAEAGRDYNTVDISQRVLWEIYLPSFKAAVDAGVATIMTAFNELDGVPCTGSKFLLNRILREKWGFQGFVVSDYTSVLEMIQHGVAATKGEAGLLAAQAGLDMDMQSGIFQSELPKLLAAGKVSEKMIDKAVRRILRLKFRLGLFDDPYAYCNKKREKTRIMSPQNLNAALDVAQKSIVLLKNSSKILPLAKNVRTIAVVGPLATSQKDILGSWSAAGEPKHAVSLLQGLQARISSRTKILYAKGCNINNNDRKGFAKALNISRQADVIIAALGESAYMSGEAASRSSLNLPGVQRQLLKKLHETGKPVILVLMNGRPLTINWASQNIPAILECWFLGTQAGHAIASVIFGDYNPSGKLPITFPRSVGQIPLYYNHKNTGRPISANKYTSKYLDIENTPLYPFGFGLSYTTFSYSNLKLNKHIIKQGEDVKVSVDLKNIGKCTGTETVQLYIRDEVASVTRPVMELKGFCKVTLNSGQSRQVSFTLTAKDLSFYNRNMKFTLEPGTFKIMVGTNSSDVISTQLKVLLR